jgi:hypothetical protein
LKLLLFSRMALFCQMPGAPSFAALRQRRNHCAGGAALKLLLLSQLGSFCRYCPGGSSILVDG